MSIIALTTQGDDPSVVTDRQQFAQKGRAILIYNADMRQLDPKSLECNTSYDLRVGEHYRDHRSEESRTITRDDETIEILPGMAVIIQTLEHVAFPNSRFGFILPKVRLLQKGLANTPSKIDPGYSGPLLVTTFNHGKQPVPLRKGAHFCAMFVSTAEGPIKPYNKPAKQLIGKTTSIPWYQQLTNIVESRPVVVPGAIAIAALVVSIIGLVK